MSIFLTGGNGYLGSYVCDRLLADDPDRRLHLLVRAKDRAMAEAKLWKSWQLLMDEATFRERLERVDVVFGDLHAPDLGIDSGHRARLLDEVDSVLHIAASLNRKSAKACLNTNLRGTLSVIKLARELADRDRLRRYSHVSTAAVAGERFNEVVYEDKCIDWDRSDYDPYGRTKKFCEHMAHELLPGQSLAFFRPTIVLGDSRMAATAQFEMLSAVCMLADLPLVPLSGDARVDIVNSDYVGKAIAHIHTKPVIAHDAYNLSSGRSALTARQLGEVLNEGTGKTLRFQGRLERPFHRAVRALSHLPRQANPAHGPVSLLRVFWPYVRYDTVFDNTRVCEELGEEPTSFAVYGKRLADWAREHSFRYPHVPLGGS